MKLIFVTGGAISGLGKGITSSSIGKLIQSSGLTVGMVKMDPYLQVDAGTMSPYEHGEVFVTEDGAETDLDIGNYERYTSVDLTRESNITTGKVYLNVINKERKGDFLGKTVQIIPHITDEIKENILFTARRYDFTIIEVGGTVGDIESQPFLESIRQLRNDLGAKNVMFVHVAPLLHLSYSGELKTKLIQYSVIKLREVGILPDVIVCRSEQSIPHKIRSKIAMACGVSTHNIIEAVNAKSIYFVPELFRKQNLDSIIFEHFGLETYQSDLSTWNALSAVILDAPKSICVGVIGKYAEFEDAYKSIQEALIHAGVGQQVKVKIQWIPSDQFEVEGNDFTDMISTLDGVLIPGGFGERGVEGKIVTVEYIRKHNIPFLGICLGMQIAVIEYARNVCGLLQAHSSEFNEHAPYKVIDLMEEQKQISGKGGTMRLGAYPAVLEKHTKVFDCYKQENISERHRHRYEVNMEYHGILREKGLILSGMSPDGFLVEFIELSEHPFFVATQAHPEFRSRIDAPHPLFMGFIKACISNKNNK